MIQACFMDPGMLYGPRQCFMDPRQCIMDPQTGIMDPQTGIMDPYVKDYTAV